jgi:hypothetical protein
MTVGLPSEYQTGNMHGITVERHVLIQELEEEEEEEVAAAVVSVY